MEQHDCHCKTFVGQECSCEEYVKDLIEKGKSGIDPITGLPFPAKQQVSWPFSFTAGALIRRSAKRHIMDAAHLYGVRLEIEEDKGWLSTQFYFTISGDLNKVTAFRVAVIKWIQEVSKC